MAEGRNSKENGTGHRCPPHTDQRLKRPAPDDRDTPFKKELWEKIKNSRRAKIEDGFWEKFKNLIIVWSPTEVGRPDVVISILSRYDTDVDVRNKWVPNKSMPSQKDWGGSVAIFEHTKDAKLAAHEILKKMRSMKVIWFPDMVKLLIDVEIQRKDFGSKFTGILISGKRSFNLDQQKATKWELYRYGDVEHLRFTNGQRKFGIICEVEYTYATQAIVAKHIMNDKFFSGIGRIRVEIRENKETDPVVEILAEATPLFETVVTRIL